MPLVKVSTEQLDAAQRLYEAASKFILSIKWDERGMLPPTEEYGKLENAVNRCKEEYEKHG